MYMNSTVQLKDYNNDNISFLLSDPIIPNCPEVTPPVDPPVDPPVTPPVDPPVTPPGESGGDENFCVGKVDGVHADPQNNTKFYMCSANKTFHFSCPTGLVFNDSYKCCTYPN